ncbi:MAG: deoxyribose-phosphate aldolase [Endomicrobiales bacterium]
MNITTAKLASLIDHTLLAADAAERDIERLCAEAKEFGFSTVCVNPVYVPLCARSLEGSPVKVCAVISFPLGACTTAAKVFEAKDALAAGAGELDMVMKIGALKSGDARLVREDIRAVREAARGAVLKVIIETGYLSKEEKVRACLLAREAGADFVKTSTGFGPGSATAEDVRLMRETVGPAMGVKAAGGIRTAESALAMISAGATRIGASRSVAIIKGKN